MYIGAASLAGLSLAMALLSGIRVVHTLNARQLVTSATLLTSAPAVLALVAFHTAMFAGLNAMSFVVGQHLGSQVDVGLMFSLCAMLKVLIMDAIVVQPVRRPNKRLLSVGFLVFATCFLLPVLWPSLQILYLAQLPRAAGIAIISIAGMAYLQQALPGRPGTASALFGNSASAGLLLSGIGTGVWAQSFGYWSLFSVCMTLCLLGAVLFAVAKPQR